MKSGKRFLFCLLILSPNFACRNSGANSASLSSPVEAANQSVRLGQGYNSLGGTSASGDKSYCVERPALTSIGNSTGEELSIYVDTISSQQEINLAVTSSQAFGASGKATNVFSSSIDYKDVRKVNSMYKSSYSYVFVHVKKTFAPESMTDFRVTTESLNYFKDRPSEFFGKCGDRFVSGVQKGAEVIAILRCETRSQEQKESIDRSVKAEAGYKGLSASGSVQAIMDSVQSSAENKCVVSVAAQGGSGSYDAKTTDGLTTSAINYVTSATPSTASAIEFQTMTYAAILNADFSHSVLDKVDLELKSQKEFIGGKKSQIDGLLGTIDELIKTTQANQPAIDAAFAEIDDLKNSIDKCVNNVYETSSCKDHTTIQLPPGTTLHPVHP